MFTQKRIVKTAFSKSEIELKLSNVTDSWHSDSSTKPFEGKINANGSFEIYPTFDYGARNQLRPKIVGEIIEEKSESKVELLFSLEKTMLYTIFSSVVLCIIGSIVSYLIDFEIKWYVILAFPLVFLVFAAFLYNYKVNKSYQLLCNLLDT